MNFFAAARDAVGEEPIAAGGVHTALAATAAVLFGGLLLALSIRETLPRRPRLPVVKEELVPMPTPEEFTVLAANADISLTPERLSGAYATHTRYRPELERLRALPLPFTEPVTEPATALAWIAAGGKA